MNSIEKRLSGMALSGADYVINRTYKYNDDTTTTTTYQDILYRNAANALNTQRRRLSSAGEGSADSSTTTSSSAASTYYEDQPSIEHGEGSEPEDAEGKSQDTEITENERLQVESFFKGLKTQVYVCNSLANLYLRASGTPDWHLKYTGIPVVILDGGEARSRSRRRIQIALAERGTSFMLWRDTIDNLSAYRVSSNAFHTMCYSSDHSLQVGFSFDVAEAAHDMWSHIEQLVSCPENISLSTPGKKKRKKEKRQPRPAPLPPKSNISQPCCFQHIISVDRDDMNRYFSLKELLPVRESALQYH